MEVPHLNEHFFTKDCCTLTNEEVKSFVAAYQAGDGEAALPLIRSQSAWIMSLVARQNISKRISLDDIYSELTVEFLVALKDYNPELSQLSTFFNLVFWRRMPNILNQLGDEAVTLGGTLNTPEEEVFELDDDDLESIQSACHIMHTHLNDFQRSLLLDHVNSVPMDSIVSRANTYVAEHKPEVTSGFAIHGIKKQISRAISIVKEELQRRGCLDSNGSVQCRFF